MNIVILLFLLNAIHLVFTKFAFNNYNYNHSLNRFSLRCIVFREKKLVKIMKKIKNNLDIYHNKSIACVAEGVIGFNDLSEDEKTLIEAVISLCY